MDKDNQLTIFDFSESGGVIPLKSTIQEDSITPMARYAIGILVTE